jgi:RNA polymerase sigma-70 factor (ECF subfamily)
MDSTFAGAAGSAAGRAGESEAALMKVQDAEFARAALTRFEKPLIRYAAHLVGDVERARDVVQDTFLKLCSQNPLRVRDHLAQWLYTVCRNRALDVRRKESRMTSVAAVPLKEPGDCAGGPLGAAERTERLGLVLDVLCTLPARQQEVLRLKFQGDLSYREIGRITGLSPTNVGFLIHIGLKAIRERIRNRPDIRAVRRVK